MQWDLTWGKDVSVAVKPRGRGTVAEPERVLMIASGRRAAVAVRPRHEAPSHSTKAVAPALIRHLALAEGEQIRG